MRLSTVRLMIEQRHLPGADGRKRIGVMTSAPVDAAAA
jgi:hypothetical protein